MHYLSDMKARELAYRIYLTALDHPAVHLLKQVLRRDLVRLEAPVWVLTSQLEKAVVGVLVDILDGDKV